MLCVFLEMPYERQLRRINEAMMEGFINLIQKEGKNNGGEFFTFQSGIGFCFFENSVAYLYSACRFLFNLNKILTETKNIISEARCIVDFFDDELDGTELYNLFQNYKKIIIPENGIFASKHTAEKIKSYMEFDLNNSPLPVCKNFKFFDSVEGEEPENGCEADSIILHRNDNYFWAIYNFILAHPLDIKNKNKFSEDDDSSFALTKVAYTYLKKHRFLKQYPQYFIDAFLLNAGLWFKTYINCKHDKKNITVYIDNANDEKNRGEAKKILTACSKIEIKELSSKLPSTYNIPEDLLELAYLILSASKYFFYDEFTEFLLSLNKAPSFFKDVYNWMFKSGLILIRDNIYASVYGIIEIIERKIGKKKKIMQEYISSFLWEKYKKGGLYADGETENIFNSLNFLYKPEFLLTSIFHTFSDSIIEGFDLKKYKNEAFFEALKYYQTALIAQKDGGTAKSYALAKTAISLFQEQKFDSGEFRALSLLAFFNLSENKIADALTYFSYAYNNAEQSNDSQFICEALFNISIVYFLQNNIKQAVTFLEKLSDEINESFEQVWKIPCLFMQGRINLQIGEFKQAEDFFNRAADFASLYFERLEPLCRTWACRALMYRGQIKQAQENLLKYTDDTSDAVLFLLESYIFYPAIDNDFDKLGLDTESVYGDYIQTGFNEFKNLKSGFNFAEDLVWYKIYDIPVGKKIFDSFYNYYNYKITSLNCFEKKDGNAFLSELEASAIETLYQNDPFSSLYLYLCYDIYSSIYGESSTQTIAYLSKAFKAMQKTVLTIGENDIRDKYMQKNLWNAKLFKAAQDHKFI